MKFHSLVDAQSFLIEIDKLNEAMSLTEDSKFEPTNEEISSFVSKRTPIVKKLKNIRQSTAQKANWRENRFKIMRGIKSFHKSTDGKRFHRKLGRLLATRITRDRGEQDSTQDKYESLNAIASLRQHLIVEMGYFHKLYEQLELEEMVIDHAIPKLGKIENKILNDTQLDEDEITFLADLVDGNTFLDELSKVLNTPFEKLKEWCEHIEDDLNKQGVPKDGPSWPMSLIKQLIIKAKEA